MGKEPGTGAGGEEWPSGGETSAREERVLGFTAGADGSGLQVLKPLLHGGLRVLLLGCVEAHTA